MTRVVTYGQYCPSALRFPGRRCGWNLVATMHERDLVAEIVETLAGLVGLSDVVGVEIALGPGVDRARAEEVWRDLTEHTGLGAAHVTWERASDLLRCGECGHEYSGDRLDSCPYCGGDGVVIETAPPISLGHLSMNAV